MCTTPPTMSVTESEMRMLPLVTLKYSCPKKRGGKYMCTTPSTMSVTESEVRILPLLTLSTAAPKREEESTCVLLLPQCQP